MLVISRKSGESVIISDDIEVTVLAMHKGTVKLGFKAPREIEIFRDEIHKRICSEKERRKMEVGT